ncbi:MAG: SusC/RagA family TonB-linked outer membrane protein [Bacteroidetes bacterium]|uniref:SusC/RagA family TonB-linked outer membrane protein n=1 Tax=Candidatus Cryptobacteroides merdigallinarum TaxID=2840770 RepID=A0A9D9EKW1_9BACT|nr:SusC/RagA family TonB-linked outer membrane protein [Candidatus Cryptobacteroides merdigallinarum]
MARKLILALAGCFFPIAALLAQTGRVEVTGIVIDEESVPVAGAGVVLKGTTIGVSTEADGTFRLEMESPGPEFVLEFSFIGMKTREVKVKPRDGRADLEVVLEMDQNELDQVVVTGIFNRRKESYTGSAVTMKGEDIKKVSTTNIAKAISVIDPSFRVMDNFEMGSDPNRLPDMRMRGTSTLPGGSSGSGDLVSLQGEYDTYPNQPLLMLDGFEIDVQTMADLDPDRIASITILKDASATAIYGSKASNGVIVIETLAPRPGAINVTYSGSVRVEIPDLSSYNLMNSEEKILVEKLAGLYPENDLASLRDYESRLREVRRGVDTYWLSQPLRTAVQHRHAVTLEGGSQALRYKLYAGLNETPGVMKGSKRSTQTASLDLSYRLSKFQLKNSVTVDNAVGTDSPYGSFSQYAMLNPYLRPYDEDGNVNKVMQTWNMLYSGSGNTYEIANPMYNATFHSLDRTTSLTIRELFKLEYRPADAWILQANVSLSKGISKDEVFRPGYHTAFNNVTDPTLKGDFSRAQSESFNYAIDFTAMYNKVFREKHYVTANLRYSVDQNQSETYGALVTGFPNDTMDHILFGQKYSENMTGSENTSRSIGGVLTAGYSYMYRYSFDATIRVDGSSQFGRDNRFAPFWSAGFKWDITNEPFMKSVEWMDDLVFATSYGITGTQGFAPYQSRQVYSYSDLMQYYLSSDATGIELVALGNDKLKWQQTATWNTRLELSLLKGRITARAEYYIKNTENSLAQITLAPSLGFSSYPANMGTLQNQGVELNIAFIPYRNEAKEAYWVISANGSHNRNKLTRISEALSRMNELNASTESISPLPRYVEGRSTTAIWAVRSLGIDPSTGDEILLKRDGSVTSEYDPVDAVICGDTEPKWQGNVNTSFNYMGFGINLGFTYRFGGQMYNSTLVQKVENADLRYNADRRVLQLRWQNPGDVAQYKRLTNSANGSNTQQTSRFVMNENLFQMSSLSLTYRMDNNEYPFLRRLHISSMRWSFNMEDIFYLSSIKRERGTDYPFSRQFALSLNLVF